MSPATGFAPGGDGAGVLLDMAVGIEPQPATESCLPRQMLLRDVLDVFDEACVGCVEQLLRSGQGKPSIAFCHSGIENIDAAIGHRVSLGHHPFDDSRQMLERLLFPGGNVRKDVLNGPIAGNSRLHQIRIR